MTTWKAIHEGCMSLKLILSFTTHFLCVCHTDYAAAQYRQYQRLTKQMKPSVDEYSREKDQK